MNYRFSLYTHRIRTLTYPRLQLPTAWRKETHPFNTGVNGMLLNRWYYLPSCLKSFCCPFLHINLPLKRQHTFFCFRSIGSLAVNSIKIIKAGGGLCASRIRHNSSKWYKEVWCFLFIWLYPYIVECWLCHIVLYWIVLHGQVQMQMIAVVQQ